MRRREVILAAVVAVTMLPKGLASQVAGAPDTKRIFRVGCLGRAPDFAPGGPLFHSLIEGLRDFGYEEGRNLQIIHRQYELGRAEPAAAELVSLNPDVIVVPNSPPTKAVKEATQTIPIVMVSAGDPLASGFIESVARPGGNITGLSNNTGELLSKQAELLK